MNAKQTKGDFYNNLKTWTDLVKEGRQSNIRPSEHTIGGDNSDWDLTMTAYKERIEDQDANIDLEPFSQRKTCRLKHQTHVVAREGQPYKSSTNLNPRMFGCTFNNSVYTKDELDNHQAGRDVATKAKSTQYNNSPKSALCPIFTIVECGGSEWDDSTIDQGSLSSSSESWDTLSAKTPNHELTSHHEDSHTDQKLRRQRSKQTMVTIFGNAQKSVTFKTPLVTSVVKIPRIRYEDRHHFFFTKRELKKLASDESDTESIQPFDSYHAFQPSCDDLGSLNLNKQKCLKLAVRVKPKSKRRQTKMTTDPTSDWG